MNFQSENPEFLVLRLFLENHTIFALFLGLSSGWLGWPFFEPWTVSSTCRCLSCWGARNSNSHWQELCWHHCDQWPAASLPMSLLNSGGVKWSSQICQDHWDIPTFNKFTYFPTRCHFFAARSMGWCSFAPIVDSWSGALVPPCGLFSELPKRFPCKAGGLIGTPLSTKKVLGWQVWLENADLFFVFFFFAKGSYAFDSCESFEWLVTSAFSVVIDH